MPQIREVSEPEFGTSGSSPVAVGLRRVTEACRVHDGVAALNEQAELALRHHGLKDARLWVSGTGDALDGFALLRGRAVDLAVDPRARRRGVGAALAGAALAGSGIDRVEAWSHADDPAAATIAARFGVPRARELKVMSRPTRLPLDDLPAPDGIRVRTFRPGDTDALLEVNAQAFSDHPEQGGMTRADFEERAGESWFDPAGLFVAVDPEDRLLGFHWTKVHRDEDPPHGEVYVVAVSPAASGRGLGRLLTVAGLQHLAGTGVEEVILYVDGDNTAAITLYRGQGFTERRTEVQYRGPVGEPGPAQDAEPAT